MDERAMKWRIRKSKLLKGKTLLSKFIMSPKLQASIHWLIFLVAVATAIVAVSQLRDNKRAMSLGSLVAINESYSEPKLQFYAWASNNSLIWTNSDGKDKSKNKFLVEFMAYLYGMEYLRAIEFVCSAYLQGLLSVEAEQFAANYIKSDIENLLLYFYKDNGIISLNEDVSIPWIGGKKNSPSKNELGGFPFTPKCMKKWKVDLKGKKIF